MENLMTQYAQPNDPQPMKDAIDTLNEMGVTFQRPTLYQLKIGELSFYPGRGTIFRDGSPAAMTEKGLDALVVIISMRQALHAAPSVAEPASVREHQYERPNAPKLHPAKFRPDAA
jgi:hypothetical protein